MKNFFKTTLYLFVFALAGILFQISCSNADDKNVNNVNSQNKLIYTIRNTSGQSIWISDYDGSNLTQVPITLPPNIRFNNVNGNADAKISPDGSKIFFLVVNDATSTNEVYSCNVNGTNLQPVYVPTISSDLTMNVN